MTVFHLQLTSNKSTFKYTFPEEFLNKEYEIGLQSTPIIRYPHFKIPPDIRYEKNFLVGHLVN